MSGDVPPTMTPDLSGVRRRRAQLSRGAAVVERALTGSATSGAQSSTAELAAAVEEVLRVWQLHVQRSEDGDGLLAQVVLDVPMVAPKVARIRREHRQIAAELARVAAALAQAGRRTGTKGAATPSGRFSTRSLSTAAPPAISCTRPITSTSAANSLFRDPQPPDVVGDSTMWRNYRPHPGQGDQEAGRHRLRLDDHGAGSSGPIAAYLVHGSGRVRRAASLCCPQIAR
jgi:hypothetical protein